MYDISKKSRCFKPFLVLFIVLLTHFITPTSSEGLVITRGPYIQATTQNSSVIRWRTNNNAESKVKYGTTLGNMTSEAKNSAHILVYGEKTVGPLSFYGGSGNDYNISKRDRTDAVYIWEPEQWTSANAKKRTGDNGSDTDALVEIVQELVDQSAWDPNVTFKDDIAFLIYGSSERVAESYDGAAAHGDTSKQPRLHIKYKTGGGPSVTVSKRATESRYDAEEHLATGTVNATSSDLELGVETHNNGTFSQVVGVKFKDTRIPNGATIKEAYIEFTVDETNNQFKDHEVIITGLQANKKYYYKIMDGNTTLVGGDNNHYFTTHPATGVAKAKTIWVLGDSGQGGLEGNVPPVENSGDRARTVRDAFKNDNGGSYHADLVLMLGDNAYNDGEDSEYQFGVFENMYENTLRNSAMFPVLGNHEFGDVFTNSIYQTGNYYDTFTLPRAGEAGGYPSGTEAYYSFDYGQIHFVCLESMTPYDDASFAAAMEDWLDADLSATSQKWIIALWHHPPYSFGTHNTDDSLEVESAYMREDVNILKKLEDNGVDMVFIGHSHVYERTMLINGHYSESTAPYPFNSSTMVVDSGDGKPTGGGAYSQNASSEGTVYVLTGSASKRGSSSNCDFTDGNPSSFYPAMSKSFRRLGSVKMEVNANGDELDVYFVGQEFLNNESGSYKQMDHFRLVQ